MTRQGKGSSPDWVREGLGMAGWSPVGENSSPAAPTLKIKRLKLGGTPRSHPEGAWQKYHSGGVVPGCIGHNSLPCPQLSLLQNASSPECSVAVRGLHPHRAFHPSSPHRARGDGKKTPQLLSWDTSLITPGAQQKNVSAWPCPSIHMGWSTCASVLLPQVLNLVQCQC